MQAEQQAKPFADLDVVAPVVENAQTEHRVPKWRLDEEIGKKKALKQDVERLTAELERANAALDLAISQRDQVVVRLQILEAKKR